MANVASLVVKVTSDVKDAQQGLKSVGQEAGGMKGKLGAASKLAAGALLAVGAAAISAGKAAAEDAQSQAVLAQALKNNVGASQDQIAAVEDSIAAMSAASGVADDQLRPAYANLIRATGDVATSQDAMKVALDVAAATGQDVEAVSKAMAKGYAGNTKALGKLVPGMDKAVLASGDMTKVMDELARTTGGASAAAADTAAGRMQRMQVAMDEAKESIGAALLPAMSGLADILTKVANAAAAHPGLFKAIAIAIAVVAGAILVLNVAVSVYQAVMVIAGAVSGAAWAAALWPILLVIAAIAALVVVVVLIVKHWDKVKAAGAAAWNAIKGAFQTAVNWIKANWLTLLAVLTGPLGIAVMLVVRNWNTIKAVASTVISWIRTAWNTLMGWLKTGINGAKSVVTAAFNAIRGVVSSVTSWVKSTWGTMVSGIKTAVSGLSSVLAGPFNAVKSAVDAVVSAVQSLVNWLGRIHVPSISWPKPPSWLSSIMGRSAPATAARTAAGTRVGAVGLPVPLRARSGRSVASGGLTVVIQGAVDPEATARQVKRLMERHTQRVGLTGALAVS